MSAQCPHMANLPKGVMTSTKFVLRDGYLSPHWLDQEILRDSQVVQRRSYPDSAWRMNSKHSAVCKRWPTHTVGMALSSERYKTSQLLRSLLPVPLRISRALLSRSCRRHNYHWFGECNAYRECYQYLILYREKPYDSVTRSNKRRRRRMLL